MRDGDCGGSVRGIWVEDILDDPRARPAHREPPAQPVPVGGHQALDGSVLPATLESPTSSWPSSIADPVTRAQVRLVLTCELRGISTRRGFGRSGGELNTDDEDEAGHRALRAGVCGLCYGTMLAHRQARRPRRGGRHHRRPVDPVSPARATMMRPSTPVVSRVRTSPTVCRDGRALRGPHAQRVPAPRGDLGRRPHRGERERAERTITIVGRRRHRVEPTRCRCGPTSPPASWTAPRSPPASSLTGDAQDRATRRRSSTSTASGPPSSTSATRSRRCTGAGRVDPTKLTSR